MNHNGMLYLCAMPIGNLEDITLRVLHTLETADVIYCEDTRNTVKLLNHYDIHKPLQSFHDHSGEATIERIIARVAEGQQVAVVSDAGMPGISDPGFALVKAFCEAQLPYTVLPGASASVTALVLSGLASDRFIFEGFLPRKGKELSQRLALLDEQTATAIIYEAPHRLDKTLATFAERWPTRQLAAVREISKRFEEVVRGSTVEVAAHFAEQGIRGEFVLILEGVSKAALSEEDQMGEALAYARQLIDEGESQSQAAKLAAKQFQCQKRALYQALLNEDDSSS